MSDSIKPTIANGMAMPIISPKSVVMRDERSANAANQQWRRRRRRRQRWWQRFSAPQMSVWVCRSLGNDGMAPRSDAAQSPRLRSATESLSMTYLPEFGKVSYSVSSAQIGSGNAPFT